MLWLWFHQNWCDNQMLLLTVHNIHSWWSSEESTQTIWMFVWLHPSHKQCCSSLSDVIVFSLSYQSILSVRSVCNHSLKIPSINHLTMKVHSPLGHVNHHSSIPNPFRNISYLLHNLPILLLVMLLHLLDIIILHASITKQLPILVIPLLFLMLCFSPEINPSFAQ